MHITKPEDHVREMKGLAAFLKPFTPPKYPLDSDISWLKQRDVIIDGYSMIAHFTQADHGDTYLDVLTLGCKYAPFIPFAVVCKAAELFLGKENLTLFEHTRDGKKIYSWMVLFRQGKALESKNERIEKQNYNGFDYFRANTDNEQEVTPNLSDID
jgi:hypothetical protein